MKPKSPCLGCKDRKENGICHSTCEDYIAFVDENKARNEMIHKKKAEQSRYYMDSTEFRLSKKRHVKRAVFKQTRK